MITESFKYPSSSRRERMQSGEISGPGMYQTHHQLFRLVQSGRCIFMMRRVSAFSIDLVLLLFDISITDKAKLAYDASRRRCKRI